MIVYALVAAAAATRAEPPPFPVPSPDVTAPQLLSAVSVDGMSIGLCFDEPIAPASVDPGAFIIDGVFGQVEQAFVRPEDDRTVYLSLAFPTELAFQLENFGIADLQGNLGEYFYQGPVLPFRSAQIDTAFPGRSFACDEREISMTTAGAGVGGFSDQTYFLSQFVFGDFDVRVELASFGESLPQAQVGLMARASSDPASEAVMAVASPGFGAPSVSSILRAAAGASGEVFGSALTPSPSAPSLYLRMLRLGDSFYTLYSPDGATWQPAGQITQPGLPLPVNLGLFGSASDPLAPATVVFRQFDLAPASLPIAPIILDQSSDLIVPVGSIASLNVEAIGSPPLRYQWRKDGLDVPGQTNAFLTLLDVQPSDAGNYDVVISNPGGTIVSDSIALSLDLLPVITEQPASQLAECMHPTTLSVIAQSSLPLIYQWTLNGSVVPGVFGGELLLESVPLGPSSVQVRVINEFGSVTSQVAVVTGIDTTPPQPDNCLDAPVTWTMGGRDGFTGPEDAAPHPDFAEQVSLNETVIAFDEIASDDIFIHTVPVDVECLTGTRLDVGLQATGPTSMDDRVVLYLGTDPAVPYWTGYLGENTDGAPPLLSQPWVPGAEAELRLDLTRLPLPGGERLNLLPMLQTYGEFHLLIENDTGVDFVVAEILSCRSLPDIVVEGVQENESGVLGAFVSFELPTFTDLCSSMVTVTSSHQPDSFFPVGPTTVVVTGTDEFGNSSQSWFRIFVADDTPPEIFCPSGMTQECVKASGAQVFYEVRANDDSGNVTLQCFPPSGSVFPIGTTVVECLAFDASGNSATCSFTVTLEARYAPTVYPVRAEFINATLSFNTQPGLAYVVEYTDRLDPPNWQPLATLTGDGTVAQWQDLAPPAASRFYRVIAQAPPELGNAFTLFEPPEPPPARPGTPEPDRPTCSPPYVYLFSGEFHYEIEDIRIPGRGLDFVWTRKYRSCPCFPSPIGWNWDFSYNICIVPNGPNIDVLDGHTRQDTYFRTSDGRFVADQFFREGRFASDGRFELVFADRGVWEFFPLDQTPAQGRIARIADRNGNDLHFQYDDRGRLTNVVDTLDRSIRIAYNMDGFIQTVTDYTGRQWRYDYYRSNEPLGGFGDLRSVTYPAVIDAVNGNNFPEGKTNVYTYTTGDTNGLADHLLLTIQDGLGQVWLKNTYEPPPGLGCSRVIRQVWGYEDEVLNFQYQSIAPQPDNGFAVQRTLMNDRMGNVLEATFDGWNRPIRHRQYTGRAPDAQSPTTDTSNRPVQPLRPDDPAFFETVYAWNVDSLPTRIIHPNLNETRHVYARDRNPDVPVRSRGNLQSRRRLPGHLGGDQPELVDHYQYDAGGACCAFNQVVEHIDPRGHRTLHNYDNRGNRVHTRHREPGVFEDYAYNEFGQLTDHWHPDHGSGPRRHDRLTYYAGGHQNGYLAQRIEDADGLALNTSYEYDRVGNRIRRIDPRGFDTFWEYNALNQVLRETSPRPDPFNDQRYRRDFHYDANNNLVRLDVENWDENLILQTNRHITTIWDYEILNLPVRRAQERGSATLPSSVLSYEAIPFRVRDEFVTEEYGYDANRNRDLVRFGEATAGHDPDNTVQTLHDERDLRFRETRAPSSVLASTKQWDYDGNGNVSRAVQGLEDMTPQITLWAHDGYNRTVSRTDAMGNQTLRRYDPNGNVVRAWLEGELQDVPGDAGNRLLEETRRRYDFMDRLIQEDRAFFDPQTGTELEDGASTTAWQYNANSQILTIRDDRGHVTAFEYDAVHRTNRIVSPAGISLAWGYDANGNPVRFEQLWPSDHGQPALILSVTNAYDGLNRLQRTATSDGVTRYTHDSRNNLISVEDPLGNRVTRAYDGRPALVQVSELARGPGGILNPVAVTTLSWDESTRLIAQTDPNGNITRHAYDSLDRIIARRLADGSLYQVGYGDLPWADGLDRPVVTESFFNGYDAHDNATLETDPNGTVTWFSFDRLNRMRTRAVAPAANVLGSAFAIFQYNGRSQLVQAQNDHALVTRYHDSLGHPMREAINTEPPHFPESQDRWTSWIYDALGNLRRSTYPGGRTVTREYNQDKRLVRICDGPCGTVVSSLQPGGELAVYTYLGPLVERSTRGQAVEHRYSYDPMGRPASWYATELAKNQLITGNQYVWDTAGRRTQKEEFTPDALPLVSFWEYDSRHQLTQSVMHAGMDLTLITDYHLDPAGNRLNVSSDPAPGDYLRLGSDADLNQYTQTPFDSGRDYDLNGNLRTIMTPASNFDFRYDSQDRLVEIRSDADLLRSDRYDALGRRVLSGLPGRITRHFYEGTKEIETATDQGQTEATFVWGRNEADLVQIRHANQTVYPGSDDSGHVRFLHDSSGAIRERYEYEDYGAPSIYHGGQLPDAERVSLSDADANMLAADAFLLPSQTVMLRLRWWGTYLDGSDGPANETFTLKIYADAGGQPGMLRHEAALNTSIVRVLTDQLIGDSGTEQYRYEAAPASPWPLEAERLYWLEIYANNSAFAPDWALCLSATGDGQHVSRNAGGGNAVTQNGNLAFELVLDRSALGNPFLYRAMRYDPQVGFYQTDRRPYDPWIGRFLTRGLDSVSESDPLDDRGNLFLWQGNNPWIPWNGEN